MAIHHQDTESHLCVPRQVNLESTVTGPNVRGLACHGDRFGFRDVSAAAWPGSGRGWPPPPDEPRLAGRNGPVSRRGHEAKGRCPGLFAGSLRRVIAFRLSGNDNPGSRRMSTSYRQSTPALPCNRPRSPKFDGPFPFNRQRPKDRLAMPNPLPSEIQARRTPTGVWFRLPAHRDSRLSQAGTGLIVIGVLLPVAVADGKFDSLMLHLVAFGAACAAGVWLGLYGWWLCAGCDEIELSGSLLIRRMRVGRFAFRVRGPWSRCARSKQ